MQDRQAGGAGLSGASLPETDGEPRSEFDAVQENGARTGARTRVRHGPEHRIAGIARGALIIAVLTTCSRILGLLRTVVFAQTVGSGCLGTAYVTANQVPNLIYELAIGGALTSAMVPVLARSASPVLR